MPNYQKQLREIQENKNTIEFLEKGVLNNKQILNENQLKLFGSPGSMFYGLKSPGKYKCIEYIGDQYGIVPDLIQTIQDLIIKKNYEDNIKKYFKIYTNPIEDRRCNLSIAQWRGHSVKNENGQELIVSFCNNYTPQKISDEEHNEWRCHNDKYIKVSPIYTSGVPYKINPEAGYFTSSRFSTDGINKGGVRIGGLEFIPVDDWGADKVLDPVLKRTRDNGQRVRSDIDVIDKKELYEACVNNCRNSEKVKMSWTKKQLFQHLLKYG